MKKGQLSLFLVLGIVIVIVIVVGLYLRGSIFKSGLESETASGSVLPSEVQELRDVVSACIEDNARSNLVLLGLQGGLLDLPDDILTTEEGLVVPYYYDKGDNKAPTEEEVLLGYANAIDSEAPDCIDRKAFPKLDIVDNPSKTTVILEEGEVKISTDFKLRVTQDNKAYNLRDSYDNSYPVNLKDILTASREITAKIVEDPFAMDFEFMLDFDFDIDIMPIDDESEIYVMTDTESILDEEPYQFMFANRKKYEEE